MGPIPLMTNRLSALGNPLTLASTRDIAAPQPVRKVVQEALRQQAETSCPQAIILSGVSGSGKTYTSLLVLRQLFEMAGGGVESDAFKHLAASITVLRSLGTARTTLNRDSSRVVR
jgi:dachs protein